jgi:excisionase family DNA binding protein
MNSDLNIGGLLTLSEASSLLGVHSNTLKRWSDQGKVAVYRFGPGRRRKFRREDVGALLMELTEECRVATRECCRQ